MKTQIRKPARERARYPEQYKQEALELWRASGRSATEVAAELGIRPPLLYRWERLERIANTSQQTRKPERNLEALETEIRRLRAEQPFRTAYQIAQRRFHHEMEMIAHQAMGMHLPIALPARFSQGLYPQFSICISPNNIFPTVAPVHHMINDSFVLDSQLAGHPTFPPQRQFLPSILGTDP